MPLRLSPTYDLTSNTKRYNMTEMVTRSKTIPKLKNREQSHSRQHKRRDDIEPDYRGSTLKEGKTKF